VIRSFVAVSLAALTGLACGRKSTAAPQVDAAETQWASEQSLHARGMTLRQSGSGKGTYKLRSDGCVRVTYRPAAALVALGSRARLSEGESGAVPPGGPICGVRGDEWTIDAPAEATWALFATDSGAP
jgi:hypothetical protein